MNELLSWSLPGEEGHVSPVATRDWEQSLLATGGNKCPVASEEKKSPHKVMGRPKACSELC